MKQEEQNLHETVDRVLETLPPVWDRIRSNLRAAAIENFGITLEQFHILRHIHRGYRSVGELAAKKQISRSAVSQAVNVLVVKGLVTRHQESLDRRCVTLELTPDASRVMEANYEKNRLWMRERMTGLGKSDLDLVRRAMDILQKTFTPSES